MSQKLYERAQSLAFRLEGTASAVWRIAVLVYLVMTVVAAVNQAWIAMVFFACLLLGVRVMYLFIQTGLAHFEIIRNRD
jgi:hypothetical protein